MRSGGMSAAEMLFRTLVVSNLPVPKSSKAVVPNFLTSIRGNFDSPICLIAPPPCDEEVANQLPLSNADGVLFHSLIQEELGLDTDKDFLVVSCAVAAAKNMKTSKSMTAPIREYVLALSRLKSPKLYVCVGSESFKHIFGRGKLPAMSMLAGSLIYHQDICDKPLFTFPNIQGLEPTPIIPNGADEYTVRRAHKNAKEWSDLQTRTFRIHLRTFANALHKFHHVS